jgi:hypothetical protein
MSMLTLDSSVPAALDRDLLYAESAPYVNILPGQQWLDAAAATTQSAFSSVERRSTRHSRSPPEGNTPC